MPSPYTQLKGVEKYSKDTPGIIIEQNLKTFFDWAFLEIGAFTNVSIPFSGGYGTNESILHPVSAPSYYGGGKVWEAGRQNWVYESGISFPIQPTNISGLFIGNTFQPATGIGSYKFNIDYPNGQIVFDTPISTTSEVKLAYSYKRVKFTTVDDPEFIAIQSRSLRPDLSTSGNPEYGRTRQQLPIVAIESVPSRTFEGMQLGGGHYMKQDILFHIYAETAAERTKIFDNIVMQHNKTLRFFDTNDLASANKFPINIKGNIVNQETCNYENLVGENSPYLWRLATIENSVGQEQTVLNTDLYGALVRYTMNVPMVEV